MSQKYAISGLDEARAYLDHPVLGRRLHNCTQLVLAIDGKSAHDIFGSPDDMKFHSSMTLFALASPDRSVFRQALDKFFNGEEDAATAQKT